MGMSIQVREIPPGMVPQASSRVAPSVLVTPLLPVTSGTADTASSTFPKPPVTTKKAMMSTSPASTMTKPWNAWLSRPPTSPDKAV